jgi:hypothetical protein
MGLFLDQHFYQRLINRVRALFFKVLLFSSADLYCFHEPEADISLIQIHVLSDFLDLLSSVFYHKVTMTCL